MAKKKVGEITHIYGNLSVAVVKVASVIRKGDTLHIGKEQRLVEQVAESMQYNRQPIEAAKKGQEIGLKVDSRVKVGDSVFKA